MDDAFRINCCPACGAKVVEQMADGRMRPVCPRCGRVHFADPKVAAAVLIEHQGQILLVRRTNEPERGRWTLPAGYVDAGEDPRQAAARECLEETGLAVTVGPVQDVLFETGPEKIPTIVLVFRGTIEGGRLIPGDDASEAAFFDPSRLPELGFESTRKAISDWQRAGGGTNVPA